MDKYVNETELQSDLAELKEQQLSVVFEEEAPERNGVMSAQEHLKIKASLEKPRENDKPEQKTIVMPEQNTIVMPEQRQEAPERKTEPRESSEKTARKPHILQALIPSKPMEQTQTVTPMLTEPSEKPPALSEPAPAPLSDMEVMERTASVWQYKEIVNDGTELHSEYHQKRFEAVHAEILGARVRGKKHKHEGTNCDDFFETAYTDDCAIVVVCDGAGSKALSRIGAGVSSETASAYLKDALTKLFAENGELKADLSAELNSPRFIAACGKIAPLVQQSAREALEAQREKCRELCEGDERETYERSLGRSPIISDFYTTFLAAVIVPLEINGKRECFMACVQIGDGCICAINSKEDASKALKIMGEADSGAFSGETDFLSEKNTKPEAISAKTRISRGLSDTIMLMTDGVADDYFPNAPQMLRLYLDLGLNGILPMKGELGSGEDPAPIRFKSVSMSQTSVALQYAKQLLADKDGINSLWDKREMLRCHSLEAFRMNIGDTPEERLRVWLDNYNERGSFDDRTLVVVRIKDD